MLATLWQQKHLPPYGSTNACCPVAVQTLAALPQEEPEFGIKIGGSCPW